MKLEFCIRKEVDIDDLIRKIEKSLEQMENGARLSMSFVREDCEGLLFVLNMARDMYPEIEKIRAETRMKSNADFISVERPKALRL